MSDGTPVGTFLLKDISIGASSSGPSALSPVFDSHLYFFAGGEFWKTDGTVAGTVSVASLSSNLPPDNYGYAVTAEKLYFIAKTSISPAREFWETDGTTIQPTSTNTLVTFDGYAQKMFFHEQKLYFVDSIPNNGGKLSVLDTVSGDVTVLGQLGWNINNTSLAGLPGRRVLSQLACLILTAP